MPMAPQFLWQKEERSKGLSPMRNPSAHPVQVRRIPSLLIAGCNADFTLTMCAVLFFLQLTSDEHTKLQSRK